MNSNLEILWFTVANKRLFEMCLGFKYKETKLAIKESTFWR